MGLKENTNNNVFNKDSTKSNGFNNDNTKNNVLKEQFKTMGLK